MRQQEVSGHMVHSTPSSTRRVVVGGRPGVITRIAAAVRTGLLSPWSRLLSLVFLVGQVCDVFTTHVALASGRFEEANPLFAPALASNQAVALLVKLTVAGLVLLAALTKLTGTRRMVVLAVLAFISVEAPAANALRIAGVL
ncbi:MAG TPA: DUF5658 family protein [Candidatus Angelobacter sp.]|nr:DUF5658 family protein [Candidatus Angelobacter sp.]